jgi:hypothetical protein
MQSVAPPRSRNSSTPTIVGTLTLVWGTGYVAMGVYVIVFALIQEQQIPADQKSGFEWFFKLIAAVVVVIGACFVLQGFLGVAAGLGTLLRKQWGRVLAFVVAVLSGLWALLFLFGSDQDAEAIALGTIHLVYTVLTFVLLIKNGSAFTRPQ